MVFKYSLRFFFNELIVEYSTYSIPFKSVGISVFLFFNRITFLPYPYAKPISIQTLAFAQFVAEFFSVDVHLIQKPVAIGALAFILIPQINASAPIARGNRGTCIYLWY